MNLLVDLEIITHLAAIVMPFDAALHRFELFEIARLHSCRREFRGAALDPAQRLEQFDQFVPAQGCHDGAAVEAKLDQAFGRQLLERFAQGSSRHPKRVGQIGFEQLLPGRKIAAHDQLAKSRRGLLIKPGPRHP